MRLTGIFKVYKDAFGDETHLITEPKVQDEHAELTEEQNPDCLGRFVFTGGQLAHFEGAVFSTAEQAYLAVFIESYQEPDI